VIRIDVRIVRISQIDTDFFIFFCYFFCWKQGIGVPKKSVSICEIRTIRTSIRITIQKCNKNPTKNPKNQSYLIPKKSHLILIPKSNDFQKKRAVAIATTPPYIFTFTLAVWVKMDNLYSYPLSYFDLDAIFLLFRCPNSLYILSRGTLSDDSFDALAHYMVYYSHIY
jgi:hypothetical protein